MADLLASGGDVLTGRWESGPQGQMQKPGRPTQTTLEGGADRGAPEAPDGDGKGTRVPRAAAEEVHRVEPKTWGWVQAWPSFLSPEQTQGQGQRKVTHQALQGFVGDTQECVVCVVKVI